MFEFGSSTFRTIVGKTLWGWKGRPDSDEQTPIFLHFLNRELWRSVGQEVPLLASRRVLLDFFLCTTAKFFAPLDFVWESGVFSARQEPLIIEMMARGEIDVLSRYHTPDEFISRKQEMYKHDQHRYPMYFEGHDKALEEIRPSNIRTRSATSFIDTNLKELTERMYAHKLPPLPKEEAQHLLLFQGKINLALSERDGAAITLSLFENKIDPSEFRSAKFAVARILSLLHTEDYLDYFEGDILSGVPGLAFFDRCSRNWPYYDVSIFGKILDSIRFKRDRPQDLTEYLLRYRHTDAHRRFCQKIRLLIHVLFAKISRDQYAYAQLDDKSSLINHLRVRISEEVDRTVGKLTFDEKSYISKTLIDDLERRLNYVFSQLRIDPIYRMILESEEAKIMDKNHRVLVITANDTERDVFLREAKRVTQLEPTQLFFRDHTVFQVGNIGGVEIGVVRIEQGALASGASTLATIDIIDDYQPSSVVMVGICFGLKRKEQAIGDVLVSAHIQGYEHRKVVDVDGEPKVLLRGEKASASTRLLDRCRAAAVGWENTKIHVGTILSGNILSDSASVVDELTRLVPEAIGAEMEGTGLYASSTKRKIDWVLIKAICDWGYEKSDEHQEAAAEAAVAFTMKMIEQGGLAVLGSSGR